MAGVGVQASAAERSTTVSSEIFSSWIASGSGVSARLIERIGARATLVPGLVLAAIGLMQFGLAGTHVHHLSQLLPALAALGIGAGLAFPALLTLAMSSATPEDSGLVSGLVNTSQQVGGALGLSVLATLSSSHTRALRTAGGSVAQALTGEYHLRIRSLTRCVRRRSGPLHRAIDWSCELSQRGQLDLGPTGAGR